MLYKIIFKDNFPGGTDKERIAYAKADDIKIAVDKFYEYFEKGGNEYPHIKIIETLEREVDINF